MPNYKLVAIQLGEKFRRLRSAHEIERTARAVFPFARSGHPNDAITSERAQIVYHWIMTLAEQPLSEEEKEQLIADFDTAMHSFMFGEVPAEDPVADAGSVWDLIHPFVRRVAQGRFRNGYSADAALAAMREVNTRVKQIVKGKLGGELDGADLMHQAFSPKKPIIVLDDLSTESGRNIQQGYMEIFAGAMMGIRNPKAHANITISLERGLHFLVLASLLMHKLDESLYARTEKLRAVYESHNDATARMWPAEKQCQCNDCKDHRMGAS